MASDQPGGAQQTGGGERAVRRHASSWAPEAEGERYELGRPGYPAAAGALLAERLGLDRPGAVVADVGAGTGKLTRVLVAAAPRAEVLAVEPMPGMRRRLRAEVPAAAVVAGLAEALPVATGRLAGVTAAQAVHWFGFPAAAAELRRALHPGGRLAVVTNVRDPAWPPAAGVAATLARHEALGPRPASVRRWREGLAASGAFVPDGREELVHEQRFADRAAWEARFASISFAILLPDPVRRRMLDELWDVVGRTGVDPLVIPLRTTVELHRPAPVG